MSEVLLAAAKELRTVAKTLHRVVRCHPELEFEVTEALRRAEITDGWGKRAREAIAAHEALDARYVRFGRVVGARDED